MEDLPGKTKTGSKNWKAKITIINRESFQRKTRFGTSDITIFLFREKGYHYTLLQSVPVLWSWKNQKSQKTRTGIAIHLWFNQLTSGKYPIALVNDGASKGTMLYGINSPDIAALDFFILLNWENKQDNSMTKRTGCFTKKNSQY